MSEMGVTATRDLTPYRDMCLLQVCEEFEQHLASGVKAPLLCSSCPGFVCYAEKTNSKLLVPKLSTVRSPQQISGLWLKKQMPMAYHVAIMPCYDKKLEAVRSEFESIVDGAIIRDVDCVLATVELEQLIEDKIKAKSIDEYITRGTVDGEEVYTHGGGGSGGYLEAILRHIARVKYGLELAQIEYTPIRRNKDFLETVVKVEGDVVLRFAKAYGFRSIQNLVSRLKQSKVNFDYVEVMACPVSGFFIIIIIIIIT
jgi:iron only hydrogenase large subunit-like protein